MSGSLNANLLWRWVVEAESVLGTPRGGPQVRALPPLIEGAAIYSRGGRCKVGSPVACKMMECAVLQASND